MPEFVRCLWGDSSLPGDAAHPRGAHKIREDCRMALREQAAIEPALVYVFGTDNYEFLKSIGYTLVEMLSDQGMVWPRSQQFRHKLEAWRWAAHRCREFIFLDFGDLWVEKQLPKDFWERIREKNTLQANLRYYHRKQLPWRKMEPRKVPSAAFVYMRGEEHAKELIRIWDSHNDWTEQQCLAWHMDSLMPGGSWDSAEVYPGVSAGLLNYQAMFAPYCCTFYNDATSAAFQRTKVELFRIK